MKSIVAIIQARTGSKRLPRKVLKKISNISLIEWVILRLKKSRRIKKIILATTKQKKDDILVTIAQKNKINFYRGPNLDVLGRFFGAANLQKTDLIIRICSDNPFIDATEVDYLIRKFKSKKYDYSCNHQNRLNSNYVDGFGAEIFTYDLLKKLNFIVKKKSDREHVTKYVWDNIKKFKILSFAAPKKLAFPKLKFDINTLKDFKKINNFVNKHNIKVTTKATQIINYKLSEKRFQI